MKGASPAFVNTGAQQAVAQFEIAAAVRFESAPVWILPIGFVSSALGTIPPHGFLGSFR